MNDNGHTTLEDLMEVINRVENDHGERLDEIMRGQKTLSCEIESVLAASKTAHCEIIERLIRLEERE